MFRFQGNKGIPIEDLLKGLFFEGEGVVGTRKEKLHRIFLFLALGLRKLNFFWNSEDEVLSAMIVFLLNSISHGLFTLAP